MSFEILLITLSLALIEVAGLMLLGRGLLWLFGPKARQGNFFYDILTIGAVPFIRLTRKVSPRFVRDEHVPALAFFLLFCLWIGLQLVRVSLCASHVDQCG
jgi:hypothetical protein